MVDITDTVSLFMDLQNLGDKDLRKTAFSHVIHSIKHLCQKPKMKGPKSRAASVQTRKVNSSDIQKQKYSVRKILFETVKDEDDIKAKRSLFVLCDLHRRKIWFDDETANAICGACFHPSSKIMKAALSFLLGYEKIDEDSDDSGSEDDDSGQSPAAVLSKEAVYKAFHKGTTASKKKKKAKLQRVMRSLKRQNRMTSKTTGPNSYSPLTRLWDAQGYADKLFSRIQTCNERFEVRMMMLKVVARTIGLHNLILLKFYPYLQKYAQPHQENVTSLLAAAVQACHHMVPPDALESLFRQVVNQFIHDRSRPEALTVGLNFVREVCLRIPLLMTEELLQDLVLYKNSHEKPVSTAARSLMTLFRQICPSLLTRKDRGRPIDPKAKPRAFGEVSVPGDVPGAELLLEHQQQLNLSDDDDVSEEAEEEEDENNDESGGVEEEEYENNDESEGVEEEEEDEDEDDDDHDEADSEYDDSHYQLSDVSGSDGEDVDSENDEEKQQHVQSIDESPDMGNPSHGDAVDDKENDRKLRKRKFSELKYDNSTSLCALKRLASENIKKPPPVLSDEILSNEDFQLIKKLKAEKEAKLTLMEHGLKRSGSASKASIKFPHAEHLSEKSVNPAKLEGNIRRKMSKAERLAMVKAGREERGKYVSKSAVKKNKTGGLSNKQKEHKKIIPLAAKRNKARSRREKKKQQQQRHGKQFRGKKAWKH